VRSFFFGGTSFTDDFRNLTVSGLNLQYGGSRLAEPSGDILRASCFLMGRWNHHGIVVI
jgi:hypothetical protein